MAVDFLVNPICLYEKATRIEGWEHLNDIPMFYKMSMCVDVADEWAADWEDGQGFGSSDLTYMVKDFLDNLIGTLPLKTIFNPYLQIIKTN